MDRTRLQFD
ncbi:unnamed protein product, partial [Didymodactylos carnosus]